MTPAATRPRAREDFGAVFVEAAVIMPLVVLLVLGVIEFGFAWRDVNQVERGLAAAARTGSSIGKGRYADFEVIRAVDASTRGMAGAAIERVVVFQASGLSGTVPPACLGIDVTSNPTGSKGIAGVCNVYSRAQVQTASVGGFGGHPGCAAGSWDSWWCPASRSNVEPNLTYLGVHVRLRYAPFTGVLPGPLVTIDRTAVYRLEPCVPTFESC